VGKSRQKRSLKAKGRVRREVAAPMGFAFAGCRLHCRRAQVWDERDGCTVLWAVISEAGKRIILSWNWESVQARAHYFILSPSFIIHPFRSRSGLEWTMSMEIDRILKLERNGRSIGVCTGLPNIGQKSVDTRNSIRNIVIPQIAITRCQVLLHLFINLLFYSRVPLNTSPPLDPCNASPRVRPNLRKTPR